MELRQFAAVCTMLVYCTVNIYSLQKLPSIVWCSYIVGKCVPFSAPFLLRDITVVLCSAVLSCVCVSASSSQYKCYKTVTLWHSVVR